MEKQNKVQSNLKKKSLKSLHQNKSINFNIESILKPQKVTKSFGFREQQQFITAKAKQFLSKTHTFESPQLVMALVDEIRKQTSNDTNLKEHERIETKNYLLPKIRSKQFQQKLICKDRNELIKLAEWIDERIIKFNKISKLSLMDIIQYKQTILNYGLGKIINIIQHQCKQQGKILHLIWENTFNIFQGLLQLLAKNTMQIQKQKYQQSKQLEKIFQCNLGFIKCKNNELVIENQNLYEKMKKVILWNRRIRRERHQQNIQQKLHEYQIYNYRQSLEEIVELLLTLVPESRTMSTAKNIIMTLLREKRRKKKKNNNNNNQMKQSIDQDFKNSTKEMVKKWLRRNGMLEQGNQHFQRISNEERLLMEDTGDKLEMDAVDIYDYYKLLNIETQTIINTSNIAVQCEQFKQYKHMATMTKPKQPDYDKAIQVEINVAQLPTNKVKAKNQRINYTNNVGYEVKKKLGEKVSPNKAVELKRNNNTNNNTNNNNNNNTNNHNNKKGFKKQNQNESKSIIKNQLKIKNTKQNNNKKQYRNIKQNKSVINNNYNTIKQLQQQQFHNRSNLTYLNLHNNQKQNTYVMESKYNVSLKMEKKYERASNSSKQSIEEENLNQFKCLENGYQNDSKKNNYKNNYNNRQRVSLVAKYMIQKVDDRNENIKQRAKLRSANFIEMGTDEKPKKLQYMKFKESYEKSGKGQIEGGKQLFMKGIIRRRSFFKKSQAFYEDTRGLERNNEIKQRIMNNGKIGGNMNKKIKNINNNITDYVQKTNKKMQINSNTMKMKTFNNSLIYFQNIDKNSSTSTLKKQIPKNKQFINISIQSIQKYIIGLLQDYLKQLFREKQDLKIQCGKNYYPLQILLLESMSFKYGLKEIAEKKIKDFIDKIITFSAVSEKIELYSLLLGMQNEKVGSDQLLIYLRCCVYVENILLQKEEKLDISLQKLNDVIPIVIQGMFRTENALKLQYKISQYSKNNIENLTVERIASILIKQFINQKKQYRLNYLRLYQLLCFIDNNFFVNLYKMLLIISHYWFLCKKKGQLNQKIRSQINIRNVIKQAIKKSDLIDEIYGKSITDEKFITFCIYMQIPCFNDIQEILIILKNQMLKGLEIQKNNGKSNFVKNGQIIEVWNNYHKISSEWSQIDFDNWNWTVSSAMFTQLECVVHNIIGKIDLIADQIKNSILK